MDDFRWQDVQCTKCKRLYTCTPSDDWYQPAEDLGWTAGRVCLGCLIKMGAVTHGQR